MAHTHIAQKIVNGYNNNSHHKMGNAKKKTTVPMSRIKNNSNNNNKKYIKHGTKSRWSQTHRAGKEVAYVSKKSFNVQ